MLRNIEYEMYYRVLSTCLVALIEPSRRINPKLSKSYTNYGRRLIQDVIIYYLFKSTLTVFIWQVYENKNI